MLFRSMEAMAARFDGVTAHDEKVPVAATAGLPKLSHKGCAGGWMEIR